MADPKQPAATNPPTGLDEFRQRLFSNPLVKPLMREDRLPSIFRELAYAVTDIRQRVFEEAWSGQVQTPNPVSSIHGLSEDDKGDAFRDQCQRTLDARGPEPERGGHGPDR